MEYKIKVVAGRILGDQVEIVDGLAEGDSVIIDKSSTRRKPSGNY
jgi:multidrug efflux pump subunit AcrA (membrane-fusion protein)